MESKTDWSDHFSVPTARDMEYVLDSWLESYKRSPWAGAVPNNKYREVYTEAIQQLLNRGAKVMLVRNPVNKDMLLGWVCFELTARGEAIIHYGYTKPVYRKQGIYSSLVRTILRHSKQSQYFYTFRTPHSRYLSGCTFRPEIARRRDNRTTHDDA